MKTDTSGIDTRQFIRQINADYALTVTSLTFLPMGEDAYAYISEGGDGRHFFVKAQAVGSPTTLETALELTSDLRTRGGLWWVVAPLENQRGRFTFSYLGYTVAVFPYLECTRAYEAGLSEEQWIQTAWLLAALHRSRSRLTVPPHWRETFDNPFRAPILRALWSAEEAPSSGNSYRDRARQLLLAERTDVVAALDELERLTGEARRLDLESVITHGDPNLANILIDQRGRLHVIDWGEIALGPPARDLSFFTGARFEAFLRHYLAAGGSPRLHPTSFAFYQLRWVLQEIADYSTRILFQNTDPLEDEHAWTELTDYLPIRHQHLRANFDEIAQVLGRVRGDTDVS
ncbi:MAG TPA: aminoglycoside phosphotransferase family protein [Chloroflexota bacterium]|nr:aminoglycoside phosphotransferase family protein [Chloroflexota bacterium]